MNETPPQRADRLIGVRVGSYLVEELLGAGGMGSVYRGVQPEIGKRVAIKFLADEFNANNDLVQRFFQEARAVNLIGHENIVDIFDFGRTPEGRNYFVMELLEGPSLERLLSDEKALTTLRTVEVGRQIARALSAAHEQGIIHRDLKPDNCFLIRRAGRTDFVKLLDFGIAKLTTAGGDGVGKTQTGMILGTPGYMAPEQAGGGVIDQRCDIYALGVMLYRMLGGKVPFDGPSLAAIFRRQLVEEAASLRQLRADVPEDLDGLILRMLQRESVDRPATMIDVDKELARVVAAGLPDASVVWYSAPLKQVAGGSAREPTERVRPRELGTIAELGSDPPPSSALRPSKGNRGPMLFAGIALTLVLGIGAVALVGGTHKRDGGKELPAAAIPAPTPAPPPPAPAPPPPVVAAAPAPPVEPPKPPGRFTARVESEPAGAQILEGEKRKEIGKTPSDVELDEPTVLFVKLPGYREEKIEAKKEAMPLKKLVLRKLPPKPAAEAAPTATPGLPKLPKEGEPTPRRAAPGIGVDD